MLWTKQRVSAVLREMIDENPMSMRAILRLAKWEFDPEVPTLAVTLGSRSVMKINPDFVNRWCTTDDWLKAAILHEFLHVILGHTLRFPQMDDVHNIALDAIINAIIHRCMGPAYSDLFSHYYAAETGPLKLLRPPRFEDLDHWIDNLHYGLYGGSIVADDVLDWLGSMSDLFDSRGMFRDGNGLLEREFPILIGDHPVQETQDPAVAAAIDQIRRQTWHPDWAWFLGERFALPPQEMTAAPDHRVDRWRKTVRTVLRSVLQPSAKPGAKDVEPLDAWLPVLSPSDRRSFLKLQWSPVFPISKHRVSHEKPSGQARVYLDTSGSIYGDLKAILFSMREFRHWIESPLWTFSDTLEPTTFRNGSITAPGGGGTDIHVVLEHIATSKPEKALVFSDGLVGPINRSLLARCAATEIHALVISNAPSGDFEQAGIPTHRIPHSF